jgi:hypothetical protein
MKNVKADRCSLNFEVTVTCLNSLLVHAPPIQESLDQPHEAVVC